MECNPFQQLCVMLTSINYLKNLTREFLHEKPTEMPSSATASVNYLKDSSELKGMGAPLPECLKKDLAVLLTELQEMKAEFSSKLNNLLLVSCPAETQSYQLLAPGNKIPVWRPLPTAAEGINSVVGERYAPLGDDPVDFMHKWPWPATASTAHVKEDKTDQSQWVDSTNGGRTAV